MARALRAALGAAAPNNGEYLQVLASKVSGYPLTMMQWIRPESYVGNANAAGCAGMCLSDPAAAGTEALYLLLTGTGTPRAAAASGGAFNEANATAVAVPGWNCLAGVFTSTALRTVYLNGQAVGTNTTVTGFPSGMTTTTLGILPLGQGANLLYSPCTGAIAFSALWSVALTPNDLVALAQGADPTTIRRQDLVSAWDDTGRDRVGTSHMTTVMGRPVSTRRIHQNPEGPRGLRTYGPRRALRVG